jgi:hypothetical protein
MKKLITIIAVVVALAGGQALAQPGETSQTWTFDADDNPTVPEINSNPYGTATATISGGAAPPEWVSTLLERDGVWKAAGFEQVTLEIPNQMVRNPYKELYIEIGFLGDLANFSVFPSPFGGTVELTSQNVEVVDPINNWKRLTAWYRIAPNPDSESVCYSFSGNVAAIDYVKVHTVCVPEPLTISLLGFGGLMVWRRRRAA